MKQNFFLSSFNFKRLMILLIILFSIIGIHVVFFGPDSIVSLSKKSNNVPKMQIIAIELYTKDSSEKVGLIRVFNKDVILEDCLDDNKCHDLADFISKNKQEWLTNGINYPVGGCDKSGCWDGTETAYISDPKFINGVYSAFSDEFSKQYSILVLKEEIR